MRSSNFLNIPTSKKHFAYNPSFTDITKVLFHKDATVDKDKEASV